MISLSNITTIEECEVLEKLANEIFPEVYKDILSEATIAFLLKKSHSAAAALALLSKNNYHLFLLNHNDVAIGYMGLEVMNDILIIDKLYILQNKRGNKIGKFSMDYAYKMAAGLNINKIELTVHRDNLNSINIYKHFGFKVIETLLHNLPIDKPLYGFKMQNNLNTFAFKT